MASNNKVTYEFDIKTSKLIDEFAKMDNAQKKAALGFTQTQKAIDSGARKYTRNAKTMSRDTRQMAQDVGVLSKGLTGIGKILGGMGLTVGGGQIFQNILGSVSEASQKTQTFHKELVPLIAQLKSPGDFSKLKSDVLGISTAFGTSTAAATDFLSTLQSSSAYLNTSEIADMRREVLRLANVTGITPMEALEGTITVYQMFRAGEKPGEFANIDAMQEYEEKVKSVNEVTSKMFATVDKGKISFREFAQRFPEVAAQAGAMGYSLDEAFGIVAAVSNLSGNAQKGMTGLRNVFAEMQRGLGRLGETWSGDLVTDLEKLQKYSGQQLQLAFTKDAFIQLTNALKMLSDIKTTIQEIKALGDIDIIAGVESVKGAIPEHATATLGESLDAALQNAALVGSKSKSASEWSNLQKASKLGWLEHLPSGLSWMATPLSYIGAGSNTIMSTTDNIITWYRDDYLTRLGEKIQHYLPDWMDYTDLSKVLTDVGAEFVTAPLGVLEPTAVAGWERQIEMLDQQFEQGVIDQSSYNTQRGAIEEKIKKFQQTYRNMFFSDAREEFREKLKSGEYMGETIDEWLLPIVDNPFLYYPTAAFYHIPVGAGGVVDDAARGVGRVGRFISGSAKTADTADNFVKPANRYWRAGREVSKEKGLYNVKGKKLSDVDILKGIRDGGEDFYLPPRRMTKEIEDIRRIVDASIPEMVDEDIIVGGMRTYKPVKPVYKGNIQKYINDERKYINQKKLYEGELKIAIAKTLEVTGGNINKIDEALEIAINRGNTILADQLQIAKKAIEIAKKSTQNIDELIRHAPKRTSRISQYIGGANYLLQRLPKYVSAGVAYQESLEIQRKINEEGTPPERYSTYDEMITGLEAEASKIAAPIEDYNRRQYDYMMELEKQRAAYQMAVQRGKYEHRASRGKARDHITGAVNGELGRTTSEFERLTEGLKKFKTAAESAKFPDKKINLNANR